MAREIDVWMKILPSKKMKLEQIDAPIEQLVIDDCSHINRHLRRRYGPSRILAIALVNTITWKRRLGITDINEYLKFIDWMDQHPPATFHEFREMVCNIDDGRLTIDGNTELIKCEL